jgi:phage shock protein A
LRPALAELERSADDQLAAAKQVARAADVARDAAKKSAEDLARDLESLGTLVDQIKTAERKADLHRKLDDLLGKGGLQRELVRCAEREIVRLA